MLSVARILVGIDFSEYSREAARYAIFFAQKLGASMTVVHICDARAYVGSGFAPFHLATLRQYVSQQQAIEVSHLEELKTFVEELPHENVSIDYVVCTGAPAAELIRIAAEQKADLIIVGTHGRTGLTGMLIGSTTEKIVRKSKCPVLTIKLSQQQFVMPG
ncbi:MAG: universal stress protein [Myxococcales bacterium]|nr:MAG: universal stress protein [Myxococcales bacterium]